MPRTKGRRRLELPGEDLELVEDFGELVRRARIKLGLTQQDLAAQLNEKLTVIKKIEAGQFRPSIQLARKLEKFLKIQLLAPVEEDHVRENNLSKGRVECLDQEGWEIPDESDRV